MCSLSIFVLYCDYVILDLVWGTFCLFFLFSLAVFVVPSKDCKLNVDDFFTADFCGLCQSLYKLSNTVNIISQYCYSMEFMEFVVILVQGEKPSGEELLKSALRHPFSGWKGVWRDLGRFLVQLSSPIAWDFPPEQVNHPNKLAHGPIEGNHSAC